jgi:hypothetical protein
MTAAVLDRPTSFGERTGFHGGGVTLEERLDAALHGARTNGSTECPVCDARMTSTRAGAECGGCGARLS